MLYCLSIHNQHQSINILMSLRKRFYQRTAVVKAPDWIYKLAIFSFLIINPFVFSLKLTRLVAGWLLVVEFIFTLAKWLKCWPSSTGWSISYSSSRHWHDQTRNGLSRAKQTFLYYFARIHGCWHLLIERTEAFVHFQMKILRHPT